MANACLILLQTFGCQEKLQAKRSGHQSQGPRDHSYLTPLHLHELPKNWTVTWQGLHEVKIMQPCKTWCHPAYRALLEGLALGRGTTYFHL